MSIYQTIALVKNHIKFVKNEMPKFYDNMSEMEYILDTKFTELTKNLIDINTFNQIIQNMRYSLIRITNNFILSI